MTSDEINARIRELWPHYRSSEIAKMLGITDGSVRARGRRMKLFRKRPGKPLGWKPERSVSPPQQFEFAPGHFALDRRSYEILTGK